MINSKPEKTDTRENRKRIVSQLKTPKTTNEAIESLFKSDIKSGKISARTWKYYVHLNKLFSPMEKAGLIWNTGQIRGPTGRMEKVWKKRASK